MNGYSYFNPITLIILNDINNSNASTKYIWHIKKINIITLKRLYYTHINSKYFKFSDRHQF